jgi:hypothetical protein
MPMIGERQPITRVHGNPYVANGRVRQPLRAVTPRRLAQQTPRA